MMLAVGLLDMAFTILRNDPLKPNFFTAFITKRCSILLKVFPALIEMIMWLLSWTLLMWCITFIDLDMLNHNCSPRMKVIWSWYMIFSMCCWIQFASILFRIFASMFIKDTGIQSSSSSCPLVWFCYKGDTGFTESVWKCSFPFYLWNSLSSISSLKVW